MTHAQVRAYRRFFETRAWERIDFSSYSRTKAGTAEAPELALESLV